MQFRHFPGNARGALQNANPGGIGRRFGYLEKETERQLMEQGSEVARLINGLLAPLQTSANTGSPAANSASPANSASTANIPNTAKAHVS